MKLVVVEKNKQGGYYEKGKSFGEAKWVEIIAIYQAEVKKAGKCSIDCLA